MLFPQVNERGKNATSEKGTFFFFFKAFSMYQALSWVQCLLYLMLFSQQSCKVGTLLLLPLLYSWRN